MYRHTDNVPDFQLMKQLIAWSVLLCCSQDNDLPTLISSVHQSHHLVMPEHPSHCDFQRGNVEIGLGPAGEESKRSQW